MQTTPQLLHRLVSKRLVHVCRNGSLCRVHVASGAAQWLEQATKHSSSGSIAGLSTSIIHEADSLQAARRPLLWAGTSVSTQAPQTTPVSNATATTAPNRLDAVTNSIMLQEQQLQVPESFEVAPKTSVPVHQLVAIFSSLLGVPKLPKDVCATTMEVKWRFLQLLLLKAAGDEEPFISASQQLLEFLLSEPARKVGKVLANPKVPSANKQLAEQRLQQLWSTCQALILSWVQDTCTSSAFATLLPAMRGLEAALTASVSTAADVQQEQRGVAAGKLMEAAAVQAVQDALPEGWTLLTSLHLLGVDGELLTSMPRGCKFEVDMLVLNQEGVAVAIIEVKLAAANPLMALVNDVAGLLRLVDSMAGKHLTCLTRNEATAAAAGKAAPTAAAAVADGAELHSRLAAMTARPPFAVGPAWHVLHIPVHQDVLPVYVLGRDISAAAVARGLNSLVSSSALRFMGRSPATLAASLGQPPQVQFHMPPSQQEAVPEAAPEVAAAAAAAASEGDTLQPDRRLQQLAAYYAAAAGSACSSSSSSSSDVLIVEDGDMPSRDSSPWSAGMDSSLSSSRSMISSSSSSDDFQSSCMSPTSGLRTLPNAQTMARTESVSSFRARIRAQLRLNPDQQEFLTANIRSKLSNLQDRCRIYSLVRCTE